MRVLFIGGTGNISSACVRLAVSRGYDVTLLTRGTRPVAFDGPVRSIKGDRNDAALLQAVAEDTRYDVVANFCGFTPDQVEVDIAALSGNVGQYIFISSASAYQKPLSHYVISESTPLRNPFWQYSRDKIACEDRLVRAYREDAFPATVVRPSHTYGETWIPTAIGGHGYTIVDRMRAGKPIVSHGDGQSLWVMTCNRDFAVGFVGLFGKQRAIGEAYHITSDEVLTWDQVYGTIARAAGCDARIVHVPSDYIAKLYPRVGAGLLGDKAYSVVFDNAKIKRLVPTFRASVAFTEGMERSVRWFDKDPARRVIDQEADCMIEHLLAAYGECS